MRAEEDGFDLHSQEEELYDRVLDRAFAQLAIVTAAQNQAALERTVSNARAIVAYVEGLSALVTLCGMFQQATLDSIEEVGDERYEN